MLLPIICYLLFHYYSIHSDVGCWESRMECRNVGFWCFGQLLRKALLFTVTKKMQKN
jgi:hypothetical protein